MAAPVPWLTRNWGTSRNGNELLRFKHDNLTVMVTIFFRFGGWSYSVTAGSGKPAYSPSRFSTTDAAKMAAFDKVAELLGW